MVQVGSLWAQRDLGNPDATVTQVDTSFNEADSLVQINRKGMFSIFKGKPGRAAFWGLVYSGGGQVYNRRYLKAGIAMALDGFFIYRLIDSNNSYQEWNTALDQFNNEEIESFRGLTSAAQIKTIRDEFRKDREYGILFFAGSHLLTIVEAFVDRQLMDFDVSDDLTLGLDYGQSSQSLACGVFYSF